MKTGEVSAPGECGHAVHDLSERFRRLPRSAAKAAANRADEQLTESARRTSFPHRRRLTVGHKASFYAVKRLTLVGYFTSERARNRLTL